MTLDKFAEESLLNPEEVCREIFLRNRDSIKIKKEKVAVKNMVTIFNTTLRLSHRKGFQAMTLRDLCTESGMSMGCLYSYFSSKEELLRIIHDEGLTIVMDILSRELERAGSSREKLHRAIRSHLYLSEEMGYWFSFFFMESKNLDKEARQKSIANEQITEQLFITILKEGQGDGSFVVENIPLVASAIKSLMQDWYLKRWKYRSRNISVEDYAAFVIDIIETYIQGGTYGKN